MQTVAAATLTPGVLPGDVGRFSVALDPRVEPASFCVEGIRLPGDLLEAVPHRQIQFLAGRYCALRAARQVQREAAVFLVPRGPGGIPIWPRGFTGSITHTHDFVSAAVARTEDVRAVAIDAERIMSPDRARSVARIVTSPQELGSVMDQAGLPPNEALTLIFSAKETLFKCLHAHVRRYFDYADAVIAQVDVARRVYHARLRTSLLPAFQAGARLDGRFEIANGMVHTGMFLV